MTIDLNKMKNRLEAKRDELRATISGLTQAHPAPINEQALLTEVLQALKRIDEGVYGLCIACGNPLDATFVHVTFSTGARSGTIQVFNAEEMENIL